MGISVGQEFLQTNKIYEMVVMRVKIFIYLFIFIFDRRWIIRDNTLSNL